MATKDYHEKLAQLKQQREQFILEVNGKLAYISGQIELLEELLKEEEESQDEE